MTTDEERARARREWLAWRRDGIGASDMVAIVFGIYGGRYAVVADKLGYDTDLGDNLTEKNRGLAWEHRIADAVAALSGLYVVGEQAPMVHPIHVHHRCSSDGFLADRTPATRADLAAGLEIKTVGEWADMHWDRWTIQTRWQMHVTGTDRTLIAAAKMGRAADGRDQVDALLHRWVYRDLVLEADLVDLADEAWAYVQAGTLPTPDTGTALPYVRKLTAVADQTAKPTPVDLDPLARQIERFHLLKQTMADGKAELDTLYSQLAHTLGPHRVGETSDGWRVTYSAPQQEVDDTALRALYPWATKPVFDRAAAELVLGPKTVDGYKKPTGARVLRVKPPKEPK